jgi:hypothetical protein
VIAYALRSNNRTDIQHRAVVTHEDTDRLSRNPLPNEEDRTDARMHHNIPVTCDCRFGAVSLSRG